MTTTIYTTGYAGKSLANLVQLLDALDADLFDIRLQPWSRGPDWRKPTLEGALGNRYRHVGALGNVNYRGGPIQIANLQYRIQAIAAHQRPVILLCGCSKPQHCHRTIVGDHLRQIGFQVEEVTIPRVTERTRY